MKTLVNATIPELQAELEARKRSAPKPLPYCDWTGLRAYVIEAVTQAAHDGREPIDFEHYVFEKALETVYGSQVWTWWNATVHE